MNKADEARTLYISCIYMCFLLELISHDTYDEIFDVVWMSTFK